MEADLLSTPTSSQEHPRNQGGSRASVRVLIVGVLGLHARVALGFAELASGFGASVRFRHADRVAGGRSIL